MSTKLSRAGDLSSARGGLQGICPSCGAAVLIHDTRPAIPAIPAIPAVTGDFCPVCGEVALNHEHGDRYSELLGAFQRQVDAAYVDPGYIAKVRKKHDLDQREAAAGVGQVAEGAGSAPQSIERS